MGKISGAISSLIGIGILAFLIYYCCLRRKRQRSANNGTVIHVTTARPGVQNGAHNPNNAGQHQHPGAYPYPYPAANYGQGQPMHGGGVYPGDATGQPMGVGYPYSGPQPYPGFPPTHGGMPMPMPLDNSSHQQASAPYPTAPPSQYNDLPPPYSDVTKR